MSFWKLKLPHKVNNLSWRAARGCLPTRVNLQRKQVRCEAQEAEAMGIWQAILWLGSLKPLYVSIELDCLPLVNGVREGLNTKTEFVLLNSRCSNLLKQFNCYHVSFIRRQANRVAHTLARASRFYACSVIFDLIPTCIDSLVINEMMWVFYCKKTY